MPAQDRTPAQRDNHLEVVRRVRIGLVSAGVLGSLGVAGFVAGSSHPTSSTTSPPAATADSVDRGGRAANRGNGDDSFSQARGEGDDGGRSDDGERSDDGSQGRSQGQQQFQPPALQPGLGAPHAGSSGS